MSENIIYCYSGSGNCLDMEKNIAKALGDTDIVMMRSFPTKTDATEAKRVDSIYIPLTLMRGMLSYQKVS